jgi:hypothetical protein
MNSVNVHCIQHCLRRALQNITDNALQVFAIKVWATAVTRQCATDAQGADYASAIRALCDEFKPSPELAR